MRAELVSGLAPGRYTVPAWVHRSHSIAEPLLILPRILDFVVYGTTPTLGMVKVAREASVRREGR